MAKKIVAIAGGSSPGLGHSITTALLSSPSFTPIILSRGKSSNPASTPSKSSSSIDAVTQVTTRYVDYSSPESLETALQGVHTVLSVILAPNPGDWLRTQVNLLHAARKVGAKRFSPSEFSMGPRAHDKCLPIFQPKVEWWEGCRRVAAEAGAKGEGFEVARFHTGYFMNYLGYGAPFETEIALGGRGEDDPELFFHLRDAWIKIPERDGGGVPRITLTELADVGRFLRAAVELAEGEWEKEMGMAGETLRFDEVGKLFEEVTGRKVRVETVKRKELERGMEECRE